MDQNHLSDVWERGDPYEQYVGRLSRRIAPLFLSWLGIPAGRKWLDLGCGTGALCAAIVDRCAPAWLAGSLSWAARDQLPLTLFLWMRPHESVCETTSENAFRSGRMGQLP